MTTITEDYVSFGTAKLLKEKGFPQDPNICNTAYTLSGKLSNNAKSFAHNTALLNELGILSRTYSMAPTLQMAMKWLREKYYIYADPIKQGNYNDCSEYYTWIVARMGIIHRNPSVADKLSYEEAAEAALKYSLENLI